MAREENIVQNRIIKYFNTKEVLFDFPHVKYAHVYRINNKGLNKSRKTLLPKGFPDLCGEITIGGIAVKLYIELKAPGKQCTNAEQLDFLEHKRSKGCIAFWCNCLTDCKNKLREQIIETIYSIKSGKSSMAIE